MDAYMIYSKSARMLYKFIAFQMTKKTTQQQQQILPPLLSCCSTTAIRAVERTYAFFRPFLSFYLSFDVFRLDWTHCRLPFVRFFFPLPFAFVPIAMDAIECSPLISFFFVFRWIFFYFHFSVSGILYICIILWLLLFSGLRIQCVRLWIYRNLYQFIEGDHKHHIELLTIDSHPITLYHTLFLFFGSFTFIRRDMRNYYF